MSAHIRLLLIFVLAFVLYVTIDLLWFAGIMKDFYQQGFAALNTPLTIRIEAALMTWMLIIGGSFYFIRPLVNNSCKEAFMHSALYGFVIYGVYDLTNFSVFAQWSLSMTIIDIVWGTFLNGLLGCYFYAIKKIL